MQILLVAVVMIVIYSANILWSKLDMRVAQKAEISTKKSQEYRAQLAAETMARPTDHGARLRTVMRRIRKEPLEYRAIFTADGQKLAEGTLDSDQVCDLATWDWHRICRQGDGYIDLHNHPGKENCPPSVTDFLALLDGAEVTTMIVVSRDYNYLVKKSPRDFVELDDTNVVELYWYYCYAWLAWLEKILGERRIYLWVDRLTARKFHLLFRVARVTPRLKLRRKPKLKSTR